MSSRRRNRASRAVRSNVATAIREGWAEEVVLRRTLRLTSRGSDVASKWDCLCEAAENDWQDRVGVDGVTNLRASLERFVPLLPLEHSHYPAGYGAADARITGGNGRDWKPVPRRQGDTVSALPLSALISQTLVAFAMAYEEKSEVAFSSSATAIKRVPPEGRPAPGLGTSAELSALQRHGFLRPHIGEHGSILRLTTKGLEIKNAYDARVRAVEQAWRESISNDIVADLHGSLDTVAQKMGVGHREL